MSASMFAPLVGLVIKMRLLWPMILGLLTGRCVCKTSVDLPWSLHIVDVSSFLFFISGLVMNWIHFKKIYLWNEPCSCILACNGANLDMHSALQSQCMAVGQSKIIYAYWQILLSLHLHLDVWILHKLCGICLTGCIWCCVICRCRKRQIRNRKCWVITSTQCTSCGDVHLYNIELLRVPLEPFIVTGMIMRALVTSMVPLSIRRRRVIGSRCRLAGANMFFVCSTNKKASSVSETILGASDANGAA